MTGRQMAVAALISAVAWAQSSIIHAFRGKRYEKAGLFAERDAVLADPEMTAPPSTDGSWYHRQKDMWPRFLEIANGQRGNAKAGEEMVTKYFAWVAVRAGFALGVTAMLAIGAVAAIAVVIAL